MLRGASFAAELLKYLASETSVADLIFALKDESWRVRQEVSGVLARMKLDTLISGLEQALKQYNVFVRERAIRVIGYYSKSKLTVSQLRLLAKESKSRYVRYAARIEVEKLARKLELLDPSITGKESQPLDDNESRELFLIGEAYKIVAEAGHIFRPTPNSDWGIDGEIEFKNDAGEASGNRVYVQLKSGDSYLRTRKSDGKEIFTIKKPRHAEYWKSQAYPVLLIICDARGQVRWMNVTNYLWHHGTNIKQVEFQGEPFTADSVKQMRVRYAR